MNFYTDPKLAEAADGWQNKTMTRYEVHYDGDLYVYFDDPITNPNCNNLNLVIFDPTNPNYDAALSAAMLAYSAGNDLGFILAVTLLEISVRALTTMAGLLGL